MKVKQVHYFWKILMVSMIILAFMKGGDNKSQYSPVKQDLSTIKNAQSMKEYHDQLLVLMEISKKSNIALKNRQSVDTTDDFKQLQPTLSSNKMKFYSASQSIATSQVRIEAFFKETTKQNETDSKNITDEYEETEIDLIGFDPQILKQAYGIIQSQRFLEENQRVQLHSLGFDDEQIQQLIQLIQLDVVQQEHEENISLTINSSFLLFLFFFFLPLFIFKKKNKSRK